MPDTEQDMLRKLGEAGYNPRTGCIEVLYVAPAAEGRGVGQALLEQCVNLGTPLQC